MSSKKQIQELKKLKCLLGIRPIKIVDEKYFYYKDWYFKKDKESFNNSLLFNLLDELSAKEYLSDDYTGFGLDIISEGIDIHDTLSLTKEGFEWIRKTFDVKRGQNADKMHIRELERYERNSQKKTTTEKGK